MGTEASGGACGLHYARDIAASHAFTWKPDVQVKQHHSHIQV